MNGQDDRPAGDDKVRAQPRGGRKIEAPIVDVRLPPGPPPSKEPSRSKAATRPHRTCETIGGAGAKPAKGSIYEGNMPHCSLVPELGERIVALVRAGSFRLVAARAVGVSEATFIGWIDAGRKQLEEIRAGTRVEMPLQAQLVTAIEQAEAECFITLNDRVLDPSGDPRDREIVAKWHGKRFAREWAAPAVITDDVTGEQSETAVTDMLITRLAQAFGIPEDA